MKSVLSEQGRQDASAKNLCLRLQPVVERMAVSSAALFVLLVRTNLYLSFNELAQQGLNLAFLYPGWGSSWGLIVRPTPSSYAPAFWGM
jgi:hypothetical protein